MLTKIKIQKTINELPDSFTIDEFIEKLIFIENVEEGIAQSKQGKVIPNGNVKKIIDSWSQ